MVGGSILDCSGGWFVSKKDSIGNQES